jgi:glycosyltransferase involved in cell wall biosynthesis
LHIAGEGPLLSKLQQMAQSLNLTHKITFLGYVKPYNLPELLAQAYVGLNILENTGLS